VALVVSGGHTNIYLVEDFGLLRVLGQTKDDAAGEAFDKGAKMLGLGYPGGMVIDQLAQRGNPAMIDFPRSMKGSLDFSFSGLKTSLLYYLRKRSGPLTDDDLPDIAASYQDAIVDVLVEKTLKAAEEVSLSQVVISGGVAANSRLRRVFYERAEEKGIELFLPPPVLCTDNAAMIAVVGDNLLKRGGRDSFSMNAISRWPVSCRVER
ncbi:MAG: tRNA (adenosine(37)-N6)-threonylcarbamoyltransferase complex transferase subunit TsaD, partial [Deltaproteobacteria bacterium]|nr:tRNA (adenosine(37)-N6)-threonylcarbamoyltransferase complex transferase subunit TsaD [Deltaproteobacteria bacterium]